ncbi:AAA family ATPase [Phycicoccus avicenniae]|uniref:AAA family ATPase n=1 Tax=Phycicoccus avicenniae TaxID=2828860 RepID=UPI003D28564B
MAWPDLYPGFTEDDLRASDAFITDRQKQLATQYGDDAYADHEDGEHVAGRHPWCLSCECDAHPMPDSWRGEDRWLENREKVINGRLARAVILGRKPPEKRESNPGDFADVATLGDLLARPDEPPMRVDGLIPSDASTLVVAQRKTGKTTLVLNLVRCLLTGEKFLGTFETRPVAGRVAVLNYEVSAAQLARWASGHGVDEDRLVIANVRGRRNPLDDPQDRDALAKTFRALGVESVIVDPFGRAFSGKSQNDSGEVGSWLLSLDRFVRSEVGAVDLVLTAHAGWNGERTRGASALEDWADAIVTMTRDDATDARYLRAVGRDIDVAEDRLAFDQTTRTLSLSGFGSRKAATATKRLSELAVLVVRAAREEPGASVADLETAVKVMDDCPGVRNGEVSKAAKYAREQGLLLIEDGGPGKRSRHFAIDIPTTHPNPSRTHPRDGHPNPSHPSYRGGVGVGAGPITDHSPVDEVAS